MRCPHCFLEVEFQLSAILAPDGAPAAYSPSKSDARARSTEPKAWDAAPGISADVERLLGMIFDDDLTDWERTFIDSTRERLEQYGQRIRMTDKQMDRLRSIAAK